MGSVLLKFLLTNNGFHIKRTSQYKGVLEIGRLVIDAFFKQYSVV